MPRATATERRLPRDAKGLGLRPALYREFLADPPPVDYVEVITENYLVPGSRARAVLDQVRERLPVVLHGVDLNLLGHAPIDDAYLDAVCALADAIDAPFVSDHVCWTGSHGVSHHDLLPTPFTEDLIDLAAERARAVQRRLGRPFGLENLSSYVSFRDSTMTESAFYAEIVRRSGCWFMLDLNNVQVSSTNLGMDAHVYLAAIDFDRVLQVHVAGHSVEPDGRLVDTHDHPAADPVLDLYAAAWRLGGPFPTMLEWDSAIPPLRELVSELARVAARTR